MCDTSEKKQFDAVEFPIAEQFKYYNNSKGLDDAQVASARVVHSDNA